MRIAGRVVASALLLMVCAFGLAAGEVVVLQGGARIELQKAPVRRGDVVLLTRADGTLLSVRAADIDWKATAAAAKAAQAPAKEEPAAQSPPETPAEAARASREKPKARVKLTDADVAHVLEEEPAPGEKEKKGSEARSGAGRLEVVDYSQEKTGGDLVVRGTLRNAGGTQTSSAHMTVTALDEKGDRIASAEAGISNGAVEPGGSVSFLATIPVGEKAAASVRFAPQWLAQVPPAPSPTPGPGAAVAPAGGKAPPAQSPSPAPTPYGRGTLYAAPVASASTTPPADGKTGYIPGMSSPDNQPKPPQ